MQYQKTRHFPPVLALNMVWLLNLLYPKDEQGQRELNPVRAAVMTASVATAGFIAYDEYTKRQYSQEEIDLINKFLETGEKAEILVLGKARIGKSYLINALCGTKVTEENDNTTGTFSAQKCKLPLRFMGGQNTELVKIWDTVGLFSAQTQQHCLSELMQAKESNAIILILDGSSNGVPDDLERLVPILNRLYGNDSWIDRTVIAATRGNEVVKLGYDIKARQSVWKSGAESVPASLIRAGIDEQKANSIPVIWAYDKASEHWKRVLLYTTIERATGAKGALTMINPNFFSPQETDKLISEETEKQVVKIQKKKQGAVTKWFYTTITKVSRTFEVANPQQFEPSFID